MIDGHRVTHVPTGLSATSRACAARRAGPAGWYRKAAEAMLRAKLAASPEPAREVRTYDLCPPRGIPPMVRQGTTWMVSGTAEVSAVFDGKIPWLDSHRSET